MKHFYKEIKEGFFDFEEMYDIAINSIRNKGHFVEIGTWFGQSASYMAVEIINSNKDIQFDVVDSMPEENWIKFEENTKRVSNINKVKLPSLEAVNLYEDNSLDFVFIDSSHQWPETLHEIKEWYKKVKLGGIIGGHDYGHQSYHAVERAVKDMFGDDFKLINKTSWYHVKHP